MAPALASIDLLLLCLMVLSLALLESPVPRAWTFPAIALLVVQTWAMHQMDLQPFSPSDPRSDAIVHNAPEAVATLAVPALTAAMLSVIFFYCARAYAKAKRRFEASQAIGNDMPAG